MMRTYAEAAFEVTKLKLQCPTGSRWKHRNGAAYKVKGIVLIEATLTPAVIYCGVDCDAPMTWCRPASEFLDGRFIQLPNKGNP